MYRDEGRPSEPRERWANTAFQITDGVHTASALFRFAMTGGAIVGWSPGVDPTGQFAGPHGVSTFGAIAVNQSAAGADYRGLAIANNGGHAALPQKKAMFKVYVGDSTWNRPRRMGAILASDEAKAIRMYFLRDLKKGQLVEAFQEGFDANAKDKAGQKAAFDKMLALVPDVKEGSTLTFTYLPGKGTTLQVADKELGIFEGKGFADAVFSIWLGSNHALPLVCSAIRIDAFLWQVTRCEAIAQSRVLR